MKILGWPARRNAAHNPYQKLLSEAVEAAGAPDTRVEEFSPRALLRVPAPEILHIHWPDAFLAAGEGWRFWPRYLVLRGVLTLARLRGTKLVWTAHNLQRDGQRHGARMARLFWPWFLRRLDGVIFMTRASEARALERFPVLRDTPRAWLPHGHYGPVIGGMGLESGSGTDSETGPSGPPAALFFGSITRYKNAARLLESFLALPAGRARLEIRGKMSGREPDEALSAALAALPPERVGEVLFEDRFLDEPELVAAIRGADLAVFPYSDVLNSGAAIFALSAGRPILASDNALFRELQELVGPDWVMLAPAGLTPEELDQALERAQALRVSRRVPDLSALDWQGIGARTLAFYRDLAGDAR